MHTARELKKVALCRDDLGGGVFSKGYHLARLGGSGVLVKWTKELEVGVPFVDADHRVLINLLNQVDTCISEREETFILSSVLDVLVQYTDYHFVREETLMEHAGYPDIEAHKRVHKKLFHKVQAIYHNFQVNPEAVAAEDVRAFLKNWLTEHILGSDFEYRGACLDNIKASEEAGRIPFIETNGNNVPFGDWGKLRIMVVDDNPNFRMLIKTILNAVGIRTLDVVASPEEGLARLSRRPADVVLCDWMMDEMTGTDFAAKVGEMELPSQVVLLTGLSVETLKSKSTDINVYDYMEKPIQSRELLDTVTRAAFSARH